MDGYGGGTIGYRESLSISHHLYYDNFKTRNTESLIHEEGIETYIGPCRACGNEHYTVRNVIQPNKKAFFPQRGRIIRRWIVCQIKRVAST